jgi:UDP-2,3-diacylglucosamine pyrophosphatase LpxH
MPKATTLIVSDLHLGAEESLDDFIADEEFADFLAFYGAQFPEVHLIINGDWIDFLQIDPYPEKRARREDLEEIYPLRMTEDQAVAATERTMQRHPRFFQALADFVAAPGRRVTVLRGNHDIEVSFPAVQARVRAALGNPGLDRLSFPPLGYWDRELGLYVEHGCQFDAWNAFNRLDDPFLDRGRRKLETPFGSVIVKTFWNRVEGEFPYVDKIRPMADSVTALLVQRPTYLLVKFDYFVDLALCAWKENLRSLLARRPRRGLPPPDGTPEAASRRLWRRRGVGRLTGILLLALCVQTVLWGIKLFTIDAHLRAARAMDMVRALTLRFALHVAVAAGAILSGRLLRYLLWRAGVKPVTRGLIYRILVLGAAGIFFEAVFRMFWLPLVVALSVYLAWDCARTVMSRPLAQKNPLEKRPLDPEVEAALALLELPGVRTVVFGHTHAPIDLEVRPGKRFINSGTWVKVVDVRNVRDESTELNTFVEVDPTGQAHLMSWRGTQPARRYGEPTSRQPGAVAVA